MKGSTKLTKVDCDLFWNAKSLQWAGWSRIEIRQKLGIGEKTMHRIAHSDAFKDYLQILRDENLKRILRDEQKKAMRDIDCMMSKPTCDRLDKPSEGAKLERRMAIFEIVSIVVLSILASIAIVAIALLVSSLSPIWS